MNKDTLKTLMDSTLSTEEACRMRIQGEVLSKIGQTEQPVEKGYVEISLNYVADSKEKREILKKIIKDMKKEGVHIYERKGYNAVYVSHSEDIINSIISKRTGSAYTLMNELADTATHTFTIAGTPTEAEMEDLPEPTEEVHVRRGRR